MRGRYLFFIVVVLLLALNAALLFDSIILGSKVMADNNNICQLSLVQCPAGYDNPYMGRCDSDVRSGNDCSLMCGEMWFCNNDPE